MSVESSPESRPGPPRDRGRVSVARLARQWYIAVESPRLRRRPLAVTVLGVPMVLFRDGRGAPAAFLDRCPHRNAPLSMGRPRGGELQCAYHGWRFAPDGRCVEVPGLSAVEARTGRAAVSEPEATSKAPGPARESIRPEPEAGRTATVFPCTEQDGFVWVRPSEAAAGPPLDRPYRIPGLGAPGYGTGRISYEIEAPLHATLENILDVPHTAFLHGGLFRRPGRRREVEVIVRRMRDRAEAEFVGETRPSGIAGKLLAPGGGEVRHVDRFILPSIAQVEYSLGERSHLIATHLLTPVEDARTRGFLVVAAKLPIPLWLVRAAFRIVALRLLEQDRVMLKAQAENVRRFGGERFTSTEADVLGSHIWWLLRRAEREEQGLATVPAHDEAAFERRIRMEI